MSRFSTILIFTVAALFTGQTVRGLECYTCTASLGNNFRCENLSFYGPSLPYNPCHYGDAVCAKYIIEHGDSLMIHRSCQHSDICHVLAEKYNNPYSHLLECQICNDRDYCNGGDVTVAIPALVLTFTAIFRILT